MELFKIKQNSENGHLVSLIFKKKHENDGVGDIPPLSQRHCQTNVVDNVFGFWNKDEISPTPSFSCIFLEYQEHKMYIFEICLILYFLKLLIVVVSGPIQLK